VTGIAGATPLLVYNRIDANRRKTRLLLAAFAVALLPVVSVAAVVIFPLIHLMYFSVSPGLAALGRPALLTLYAGFFLLSMVLVTLVLEATVDRLVSSYGPSFILRLARAQPVGSAEEPELLQLVEHLCIATGLSVPRVHLIESSAPNAFAVGRNPDDASLVTTRGLLQLLDRRELAGVVAHELSHIGNHDIALSTTLAAFIGTVSLPLKVLFAPLRIASGTPGPFGVIGFAAVLLLLFVSGGFLTVWEILTDFIYLMQVYLTGNLFGWAWELYARILPLYVLIGAPGAALLIRRAVSHQRTLLADADAALLTRDPEGLALALVKIRAATGDDLFVGEDTAHLYFVDPMPRSWLHLVFPSHPSLVRRFDLLARMGNGVAPSAIQRASDAGARFQSHEADLKRDQASPKLPGDETASMRMRSPSGFDGFLRLYDQPADGSRLLALLPEDAVVSLEGREGDFMRVKTKDGTEGYLFQPT
jgi:heat shock protein HtpX